MVLSKKKGKKYSKKTKKSNSKGNKVVKKIVVSQALTNEEIESKEGQYFDENHYTTIINQDCDIYRKMPDGKEHLLCRFRKNVLTPELCKIGMKHLKKPAMKKHANRGASAGLLDYSKMPGYVNDPKLHASTDRFRINGYYSKSTGKYVKDSVGNIAQSNILGYFDRKDRNGDSKYNKVPCRTTAFTRDKVEEWKDVVPLFCEMDALFKELIPDKHKKQKMRAQMTKFVIQNTAFSTITINYNWRTALHKDAGDYEPGFGNLVVLEEGKYEGGYLGFPQYKIAVDVRQGDFLGMDVHQWHCNTEIKSVDDYTRLSIVAYLREKMILCKNEQLDN